MYCLSQRAGNILFFYSAGGFNWTRLALLSLAWFFPLCSGGTDKPKDQSKVNVNCVCFNLSILHKKKTNTRVSSFFWRVGEMFFPPFPFMWELLKTSLWDSAARRGLETSYLQLTIWRRDLIGALNVLILTTFQVGLLYWPDTPDTPGHGRRVPALFEDMVDEDIVSVCYCLSWRIWCDVGDGLKGLW